MPGNQFVYIALGSNLNDREENLREALARIQGLGFKILRASSIYETEPVGYPGQPWFLNQVIQLSAVPRDRRSETARLDAPQHLLSALLEIEREMGRERTIQGGSRPIDIDLLLHGEAVLGWSGLSQEEGSDALFPEASVGRDQTPSCRAFGSTVVPHPRMHLRRFVLVPLCEIAPEQVHPVIGKTCRELLSSLADPHTVRFYAFHASR